MVVFICTGTPGTGKTEISKQLAKMLNYEYIDVNKVIEENNLIEKYDEERKTNIVDEKKVANILIKFIQNKKNLVIDSHLSHYVPKKYVDYCIVLKCDIKELKKRLQKRNYHKEKIKENLDAEIFDICLNEALGFGHNVLVFDSSKLSIKEIVTKIKNETNIN